MRKDKNNEAGRRAGAADIHAGKVLRGLRRRQGMTQERLADLCGITFQQIQKYERGANRMSVSRIDQMADIFDVAPGIFFRERKKNGMGVTGDFGFNRVEGECLRILRSLPSDEDRKKFVLMMRVASRVWGKAA